MDIRKIAAESIMRVFGNYDKLPFSSPERYVIDTLRDTDEPLYDIRFSLVHMYYGLPNEVPDYFEIDKATDEDIINYYKATVLYNIIDYYYTREGEPGYRLDDSKVEDGYYD